MTLGCHGIGYRSWWSSEDSIGSQTVYYRDDAAFEISNSKIKNLEKSSILFNMRSFLKEKMEKHVEDLWQFETTVFWSCQRKMFSDNLRSICVSSLVERRISNERVDVARNLSSRSSSAGSFHPPEAKKDLSRLSCADSSRPPEAKNYFISSAGGRNTMTGPTGLRFSGGSARQD